MDSQAFPNPFISSGELASFLKPLSASMGPLCHITWYYSVLIFFFILKWWRMETNDGIFLVCFSHDLKFNNFAVELTISFCQHNWIIILPAINKQYTMFQEKTKGEATENQKSHFFCIKKCSFMFSIEQFYFLTHMLQWPSYKKWLMTFKIY